VQFLQAAEDLLVFERRCGGSRILCAFNLGLSARTWRPGIDAKWQILESVGGAEEWSFPPLSGLIARCMA
jgi:hypothetical protein